MSASDVCSSRVIHPPDCATLSTEKLLTLLVKWCVGRSGTRCASCRTVIQHKVQAAKQARSHLARTKPWRLTKQTYLIDAAITEVLSRHEILCAPQPFPAVQSSPVTWAHRLHLFQAMSTLLKLCKLTHAHHQMNHKAGRHHVGGVNLYRLQIQPDANSCILSNDGRPTTTSGKEQQSSALQAFGISQCRGHPNSTTT